ncbi:MAG: choice-of-anchor D domain-containing protein [Calditrichaeota bacterium]|nr:choice-of-anchor D domain-containing protein [Calditrichota bacterium]MCB9367659.1 choice-of-anchor D domain-containing protein [Calditrichota bacterium]
MYTKSLFAVTLLAFIALLTCAPTSAQVLVRDIPAPSISSTSLTFDGEYFWSGDNNSNRLIMFSPVDGSIVDTVFSPVNGSDGLAYDGDYLWTISGASARRQIYKIDPLSGALLDSIPDPAQSNAGGLSVDGTDFWVGRNFPTNKFLRIAQSDGALLDSVNAPGNQIRGVAYNNGMIWATSVNTDGDFVYWVNAATGAVQWQFELPEHVSLPDRRLRGVALVDGYLWLVAYAQNSNSNRVLQYDVSNAVQPDIVLDTTPYSFGECVIGHPLTWELAGLNAGNAILSLDSIYFRDGTDFFVTSPPSFPFEVAGETDFTIVVQFGPQISGDKVDTLVVESNDPDEGLLMIRVTGEAFPDEGQISLNPVSVDFGDIWVPNPTTSTTSNLEISNFGHGELTISSIEITSGIDFRIDPITLPVTIPASEFATVRLWFEPDVAGNYGGVLSILSNDPDQPQVNVVLTGRAFVADFEEGTTVWTYHDPSDNFDVGINGITAVNDANGDGIHDVVATTESGLTVCLNGASSGTADTLWTYNSRVVPSHSGMVFYDRALATIDDITGDGVQDVLIGTTGNSQSVYALSGATGEELWMFDTDWWGDGGWVNDVEGFVDINGDFITDVLACGSGDGSNGSRRVFALSGDNGELLWEGPAYTSFYSLTPISDVSGDGVDDVVGGTTTWVVGIDGATGGQRWQTNIGGSSPVFDLERMGNANPQTNNTEDVAVASAYLGVYVIDGGTGQQLWLQEIGSSFVYELTIIPDISGDDVSEVVVGTTSGRVICYDGAQGFEIWNQIADPDDPRNVLAMTTVPDVTGDHIADIVCGSLSNKLIVMSGWDGDHYFDTFGQGVTSPVDAVGILPDIDGSNAFEILMGNREGWVDCVSGGEIIISTAEPVPVPTTFAMRPAYPNPFNPSTSLSFTLPGISDVQANVYDVNGRLVRELLGSTLQPGEHSVQWDGRNNHGQATATGVYFVRLQTSFGTKTQKLLLLK